MDPADGYVDAAAADAELAKAGRVHPHQKPLALLRDLIGKCPPGTVLDPFLGSGSTAVAARQLGRPFVGVELDPEVAAVAVRRLQQQELFALKPRTAGEALEQAGLFR